MAHQAWQGLDQTHLILLDVFITALLLDPCVRIHSGHGGGWQQADQLKKKLKNLPPSMDLTVHQRSKCLQNLKYSRLSTQLQARKRQPGM